MNKINFGTNQFCGPSVMSAICGITTDEAEAVIQSITKSSKKVTGVWDSDLKKAFESLKYEITNQSHLHGLSIFKAIFSLQGKDGYYIFVVGNHFIAIEVNGNHTKSPINISSRLGQKVIRCFKVARKD